MDPERGRACPQPSGLSERTRTRAGGTCWQGGRGKEGRRKEGTEEAATAREGQRQENRSFVCEGPALCS